MAHRIEGTTIYMTRGDTFPTKVILMAKQEDGSVEEYVPTDPDKVVFSARHAALKDGGTAYLDSAPVIGPKVIPNATQVLQLDPSDTINLGFGKYNYDIKLINAQGRRTFLEGDLILEKETLGPWNG